MGNHKVSSTDILSLHFNLMLEKQVLILYMYIKVLYFIQRLSPRVVTNIRGLSLYAVIGDISTHAY